MQPINEVRADILSHANEYPQDGARYCEEFVAERAKAVEAIVLIAESESRDLRADEARAVAKIGDELSSLRRLRESLEQRGIADRQRELAEYREAGRRADERRAGHAPRTARTGAVETVLRHADSARRVPDALREAVVQVAERSTSAGPEGAAVADWLALTAAPDYLTAFQKTMRDPQRGHMTWTPGEQHAFTEVQQRSMIVGSNAAGGYAVPAFLDPAIIVTGTGALSPIRQLATVRQVATSAWKGLSAAQVAASWTDELAEVDDVSPTLAQPVAELRAGKAWISASFEFLDDVSDWANEVARLFADAKANLELSGFFDGNGTTEPEGLWARVTATTNSQVLTSATGAVSLVDLMSVQNDLPARYSRNAKWLSHVAQINRTRALAMAQTGAGVWQDLSADGPASFLGRSYFEWSAAPPSAASNDFVTLYGDVSAGYTIADHVGGTRIEVAPMLFGATNGTPTAARGFLLFWRTGAVVTNADAFRVLQVK